MKPTREHNERMAKMKFASVYPHYLNKIEKKGRTKKELFQVIEWLTGYEESKLQDHIDSESSSLRIFYNCLIST